MYPRVKVFAGPLAIEHLQVSRRFTNYCRVRGVHTISELLEKWDAVVTDLGRTHFTSALDQLESSSSAVGVDWYRYWEMRDFVFSHQYLTSGELDTICQKVPDCPISVLRLGSLEHRISKCGYAKISQLVYGLKSGLPNLRLNERDQNRLAGTIVSLVRQLRNGRINLEEVCRVLIEDSPSNQFIANAPKLFKPVLDLDVGVLHLGSKTHWLRAAGLRCIGDLVAAIAGDSFPVDAQLPVSELSKIKRSLEFLAVAQCESGLIDWDRYCQLMCIPLLPSKGEPSDGRHFVEMIDGCIREIGEFTDDGVIKMIVLERLSKYPAERATLEEIGRASNPPISRERVRQKETRFLQGLAAALVFDDYSGVNVHFRTGFAWYWRRAAEQFSGLEDVDYRRFVTGLERAWSVDLAVLSRFLPFARCVITSEVTVADDFGEGYRLNERLLNLDPSVGTLPIRMFQFGGSIRLLEQAGIFSLSDFVEAVKLNRISTQSSSSIGKALDHLLFIGSFIQDDGSFDWDAYSAALAVAVIPAIPIGSPLEFLRHLPDSLIQILKCASGSARASEIFSMRTSKTLDERPTLAECAAAVGTKAPIVKISESNGLRLLNRILSSRSCALAGASISERFFELWEQAARAFDEVDGDVAAFIKHLGATWSVERQDIVNALPSLIAVMTGYPFERLGPGGRRFERRSVTKEPISRSVTKEPIRRVPVKSNRVTLRGFVRPH